MTLIDKAEAMAVRAARILATLDTIEAATEHARKRKE